MQLVIAEKPSVARDLARVLGVRPSGRGGFEGKDHVITWCIGHLVELDEPASYDQRWKAWRLDTLPMIPAPFKLRPVASSKDQLRAVHDLLLDQRFSEVVNACDAGREGELIFRYVYDIAKAHLPIRRLWISSMTDEAIRQGFAALKPGAAYDALADAARCRSEADWLVGLNATRAVTVRHRSGPNSTLYSIGRVQTPTLGILVAREQAIRSFVPRDYWELAGTFKSDSAATAGANPAFTAKWAAGKTTRFGAQTAVEQVLTRVRVHAGRSDPAGPVVESVRQKKTREAPPLLFDLTSLQRTANRRFGLSAQTTLEAAQALYERHKILTYPRTDARHLSSDMAAELPKLFRGVAQIPDYAGFVAPLLAKPPNPGKRVFDDKKIHDHHAIVPTGTVVAMTALGRDEHRVFDLVVRRFLGAFYPDAEFAVTRAVIRVGATSGKPPARPKAKDDGDDKDAIADETLLDHAPPPPDRFVARGRVRLAAGWQEVAGFGGDDAEAKDGDLPPLADGQRLDGTFAALAKATKPPPRHTEATLLGAMETAGKDIEDDELRAAMKDTGLGTPATRAATIETLVKRRFIARDGKQIVPTALGVALIEALPVESLSSPELTGQWEARLSRIARGQETRAAFMNDIVRYVRESVDAIRGAPVNRTMATNAPDAKPAQALEARKPRGKAPAPATAAKVAPRPTIAVARAIAPDAAPAAASALNLRCPRCKRGQMMAGKRGWGCSRWREGCGFVVWFDDNGKRRSEADLKEIVSQHA